MIRKILLTTVLFITATLSCFAQLDIPCDGTDADAVCPLDSWVALLAVAAFAVTIVHLYRKQKSVRA